MNSYVRFLVVSFAFLSSLAWAGSAEASMTLSCVGYDVVKQNINPAQTVSVVLYRDIIYLDRGLNKKKTILAVYDRDQLIEELRLKPVEIPPGYQNILMAKYVGFHHRYRADVRLYHPRQPAVHGAYRYPLDIIKKSGEEQRYFSYICKHGLGR